MRSGGDGDRPFIAWRIGELKKWMKADRNRHRLDAQVVDPRRHLQHAVAKPMGHLDGVRKRKLLHPQRLPEEFQPAGDPGRLPIGARLNDVPGSRSQKSVNRVRAANVSQAHVERVSLAVCVKRLFIEPVGPWREEGNANRSGPSFVLGGRFVREAKDIVSFHFHFDCEIAQSGKNRDGRLARAVIQLDNGAELTRRIRRGRTALKPGGRPHTRCDDPQKQRRGEYASGHVLSYLSRVGQNGIC